MRRILLTIEFVTLFVAAPIAATLKPDLFPWLLLLWGVTGYCVVLLMRDASFNPSWLWDWDGLRRALPGMLGLFGMAAVTAYLALRCFEPALLFDLPKKSLTEWLLLLILYPLTSVLPQTIVFRAFFFHRYQHWFGKQAYLLIAGAATFAFVHIIFRNPVAVLTTLPAGLLFGQRYLKTKSAPISAFEHALYGCMIFTIGLGRYFGSAKD